MANRVRNPEIYVKGYGKNVTKQNLKTWFRQFGKITCIQYKGPYSFIEFQDYYDAQTAAKEMNDKKMQGFRLVVEPSGKKRNNRSRSRSHSQRKYKRRSRSSSDSRSNSSSSSRSSSSSSSRSSDSSSSVSNSYSNQSERLKANQNRRSLNDFEIIYRILEIWNKFKGYDSHGVTYSKYFKSLNQFGLTNSQINYSFLQVKQTETYTMLLKLFL